MGVTEIEAAIAQLPANEFAQLIDWLETHYDRLWDRQIEDDLARGRLDAFIDDAELEYGQGLARPQ